jgi:hypothetical protein
MPHRGNIVVRKGPEPVRKCIVCGARRPKFSLTRLVLDAEAEIMPDPAQHLPGRGAYACAGCLARLRCNGVVKRAFRYRAKGIALDKFEGLSAQ